jgi:phasin family protein
MANPRQESVSQAAETTRRMADETSRAVKENVTRAVDTTRNIAKETTRAAGVMAEFGEQAARAGSDVLQHNAEAVQQAWQSGSEMATRLTERSLDQFARAFGITGGETEKAVQQSSQSLQAIVRSSAALVQGTQDVSREWFDFARQRTEQNFERLDALMHCRTPQEITAVQSELVRENLEGLLQGTRRLAEVSMKAMDEGFRKMGESTETARRAA